MTTSGTATVTTDPPAATNVLINPGFETGNLTGWAYSPNNPAGWPGGVVQDSNAVGETTWVFQSTELPNVAGIVFFQSRTFQVVTGFTYNIAFSARNSHYPSGTTIPTLFWVIRATNGQNAASFRGSSPGGTAIGNNWIRFESSFSATSLLAPGAILLFDFERDPIGVTLEHDDIGVQSPSR